MAGYNISEKNPKYLEYAESWQVMADCMDGEDEVKARGQVYLPMKSGMRAITDEVARYAAYDSYKKRAEFPELVSPTVRGSVGMAHEKKADIKLPESMEYLREKATSDGQSLDDLHQQITTQILTDGRYGLLPGPLADGTFVISGYGAAKIINWDSVDGRVSYVVLDESTMVRNPETNSWSNKDIYLELKLEDGRYLATRYNGSEAEEPVGGETPRKSPLDMIPFVFVNTANLLPDPDDVPLYGLSKIALRIYRLDADYMQGLHMTSEPTPWVNGFTDPAEAVRSGTAPNTIGAARIWILPEGAQAGFLEFSGPGLEAQAKAIASSLERAVIFGAQLLSENTQSAESGESRRMRLRSQRSLLRQVAITSASALERVLKNIALWSGLNPDDVSVSPYLDFDDYSLDAQMLTALVAGWQAGAYSKETLFFNLKRGDMVPQDRLFDDEQEMIDNDPALAGMGGTAEGDSVGSSRQQPAGGGQ